MQKTKSMHTEQCFIYRNRPMYLFRAWTIARGQQTSLSWEKSVTQRYIDGHWWLCEFCVQVTPSSGESPLPHGLSECFPSGLHWQIKHPSSPVTNPYRQYMRQMGRYSHGVEANINNSESRSIHASSSPEQRCIVCLSKDRAVVWVIRIECSRIDGSCCDWKIRLNSFVTHRKHFREEGLLMQEELPSCTSSSL